MYRAYAIHLTHVNNSHTREIVVGNALMTSANNGEPKLQPLQFSKQIPADSQGKCQQQCVTFYHVPIAYFTPSGKSVIFPRFEF